MKNLSKLNLIILAFLIILTSASAANDQIIPLPKPSVDQEITIKTAKKKEIYPQKKPESVKEEKTT